MDESPVFKTDWYDSVYYYFVNRTSHIHEDETFIRHRGPRYVNYSQTKPEHSTLHNCTAALTLTARGSTLVVRI